MPAARVSLLGGAYKSRSLIASSQRCVNLFPEKNDESSQSPAPFTHLMRAGNRLLKRAPVIGAGRGLYRASDGQLFAVIGPNVYYVDADWNMTLLGTMAIGKSIVSMSDNGISVLAVDGTTSGYSINLGSRVMVAIVDPAFYGADRVEYAGSAFLLNRPGTSQFYVSGFNALTFDPLDFGQKTSSPDPLAAIAVLNNQAWLLGTLKGEVWFFAGSADFPWQQMPNVQIEHGTAAKYSVAATDKFLFWLTQDKDGKPWIAQGDANYAVRRVSTYAIDAEIQDYATWSDAVGFVEQQFGHTFYVINFPSADKTWAYDLSVKLWHQRAAIDANGNLHRAKPQLQAYAYNTNVVLDWRTGDLYESDPNYFLDDDTVFPCIRSFPNIVNTMERISYRALIADVEVGTRGETVPSPWSPGFSPGFGPLPDDSAPQIFMRQSINRGKSFQGARAKSLGKEGEYKVVPKWWRLSQSRDTVFEFSWAANAKVTLNGAFLDPSDAAET